MFTRIKTNDEVEAMREGGKMLASVLQLLKRETRPAVTPRYLAGLAGQEIAKLGGIPACKGYHGYPDVICISVNNQVQHAIPTDDALEEGDVVNYDFVVRYKSMVTDAGITVGVGEVSEDNQRLIRGTEQALIEAIDGVRSGCRVGDISSVIERVLKRNRLGIVRDLAGHGVGDELHEDPNIPNYGHKNTGPIIQAGMTIAVEPIATLGSEKIILDPDGWTLWTEDGSFAAQFEHTLLITETGAEVLTRL